MPDEVDYRWIADAPDAIAMVDEAGIVHGLECPEPWRCSATRTMRRSAPSWDNSSPSMKGRDEQRRFIAEDACRAPRDFEACAAGKTAR